MPLAVTAAVERYWPELDGLRAVAVTLVLLLHTRIPWARGGAVGVDIFFTLSGYLITSVLLAEHRRTDRIALGRFYIRRLLRLYPALVVLVAFSTLTWISLEPEARLRAVRGALLTITYSINWFELHATNHYFGVFGHTWSLAIEEQFYLAWPVMLLLLVRWRGERFGVFVSIAMICLSMLYTGVTYHLLGWKRVYYGTDARFPELLIGSTAAMAYPSWKPGGHIATYLNAVAVISLGAIAAWVVYPPPIMFTGYIGFSFVALASGAVILMLATRPWEIARNTLGSWPLIAIGRISYGVYLWHWPIIFLLDLSKPQLDPYIRLAIAAPASVGIAYVSHRWIESPFLQLKKRLV